VETTQTFVELRGKLSWKMDCAARWNLYRIHTEVFAKAHWAERGTLDVARAVSERFFGGHVPQIVRYGDVHLSRSLSGRLLGMIPPPMLRRMLTEHLTRDLDLTPEFVEHFAETFEVRPGLSYADYVRRELPSRALEVFSTAADGDRAKRPGLSDADLVGYGNRFSEHFFGKRHELRLPDADTFPEAAPETIELARELIEHALSLRAEEGLDRSDIKQRLKGFLAARQSAPAVYPFLRRLFHQEHGPNLTTLLAIFPRDYLHAVHTIVAAHAREGNGVPADRPRSRAA
jgi:lysyl-tRNA synthetase class I